MRDAVGNETVLKRTDSNFPALVTEVRSANGRVQQATYDSHGNILTAKDVNPMGTGDATTTFEWNTTWDVVTKITQPTGEEVSFGYDGTTGNRTWQQPGSSQDRRVTFEYNALLLLRAVEEPGSLRDSISYNAHGNVASVRSPMGFVTSLHKDAIGRDTLIVSPNDSAQTKFHRVLTRFDALSRDTLSRTWATDSDTAVVRTRYDAEGNVDSLAMQSIPDINSIGSISRAFGYDRLNRKTSETVVGDRTDTWTYDPAGNVLGSSKLPPTTYDVLNRMMTRNIDGDTARFTYDAAGNMLSAVNRISRIFRSYHRNGALKTDTARTSTDHIAAGDFSQHVYGLRFSYDLSGRRTAMKLPGTLDSSSDSVSYSYDPVFGQLAEVKDLGGVRYKHSYDNLGRLSGRATHRARCGDGRRGRTAPAPGVARWPRGEARPE